MAEQDNLYKAPQSEVLQVNTNGNDNFLLEPRSLSIGYGWSWLTSAFSLFKMAPISWILISIVYFIIFFIMAFIPILGAFIPNILIPIFMAGFILASHKLKQTNTLKVSYLFDGFSNNTKQLLLMGLLYFLLTIVCAIPIIIILGSQYLELITNNGNPEYAQELFANVDTFKKLMLGSLISMAIYVPVLMALWFAPAISTLQNLSAIDSMKLSFKACLRNILPFLWYGIVAFIMMIIAAIPLGLGYIILIPLMIGTLYTSYISIFTNSE